MNIYSYNPHTREYVGQTTARTHADSGRVMLPAGTTETAPPADIPTGQVARWTGAAWELVEDHRGEIHYSIETGQAVTITELGPIPDGLTDIAPGEFETWDADAGAWVFDLVAAKNAKRQLIQAEKNRVRDGGFEVDGVLFDSDISARVSYSEIKAKLAVQPGYVVQNWKASTGIWVVMDAALYAQVEAAGEAHQLAVFNWQKARDAEVAAAGDAAALEAVSTIYS
ncbi:MAG: DUF4376 domain-containing protein [Proteobacteria bacterium]|nr:DUF4376 domain-containing protein [Pseudomonadota bacterium]